MILIQILFLTPFADICPCFTHKLTSFRW